MNEKDVHNFKTVATAGEGKEKWNRMLERHRKGLLLICNISNGKKMLAIEKLIIFAKSGYWLYYTIFFYSFEMFHN